MNSANLQKALGMLRVGVDKQIFRGSKLTVSWNGMLLFFDEIEIVDKIYVNLKINGNQMAQNVGRRKLTSCVQKAYDRFVQLQALCQLGA